MPHLPIGRGSIWLLLPVAAVAVGLLPWSLPPLLTISVQAQGMESQGIASRGVTAAPRPAFSGRPWPAKFTNVAAEAGLTTPSIFGSPTRIEYLLETTGGALGWIDFDRDGDPDLVVLQGQRFGETLPAAHHRLYRNEGNGKFTDVSQSAGFVFQGWGNGLCVGDFDNDGWDDLFIAQWGQDLLLRNNQKGGFTDVTAEAGLARPDRRWGSGSTFVDFDRDGDLDLFVSNYLEFDPATSPKAGSRSTCNWKGIPVACGPRGLPPNRHYLFRNDAKAGGGRTFVDVSQASGVAKAQRTYGMTAVATDIDDDGWPDIYVASDSTPSLLFHNLRNGTFAEEGLERGIALNEDGREQAGMGLAVADYNADGRLDLFKTHFAEDSPVLYRNAGEGQFQDQTIAAGLAVETRYVGWGTGMADFDNDGWPDIYFVTGQVYPDVEKQLPQFPYRSPALLFRNLGNGRFEQISAQLGGPALDEVHSSRGSATADYDGDGDLDIAIWNRNEPPSLWRNDLKTTNRWLQIAAPIGTRVTISLGANRKLVQEVLSQESFSSAAPRVLHFGVGTAKSVAAVVRYANGKVVRLPALATNQRHRLP